MKIIQVHNYYKIAGGEDTVVKAELEMLQSYGHEVITYYRNNADIRGYLSQISTSIKTIWNHKTYTEFRALLQRQKPDIVHCHNTFPLISPSIYWACAKENTPVVQTIHNYRLLCLNSQLLREIDGHCAICELCLNKRIKYPGIRYRCYRNNLVGSFILALMLFVHRALNTWGKKITTYIFLTEFQKSKFREIFSSARISFDTAATVKPNFVNDQETPTANNKKEKNILFVGRLGKEKGCDILINGIHQYIQKYTPKSFKLKIIGDGPEKMNLQHLVKKLGIQDYVEFTGKIPRAEVLEYMRASMCLVFPSIWYEGFPMTILEAFQQQCPVLAAGTENIKSIISEGYNGLVYQKNDPEDLADKLDEFLSNYILRSDIIKNATYDIMKKYTQESNYKQLLQIYRQAVEQVSHK